MRVAIFCLAITVAGAAAAQTGPALMLKPFPEGQTAEFWTDIIATDNGETDNQTPNVDVDLTIFDLEGRWRITGEDERNVTIGTALTHIDINTSFALLPDAFTDHSVGVGFNVGECHEWQIDAVVGFGYAGSNAYGEGNGWYGMADIILTKELDEDSTLQFLINYDGNRTIWPDVPLPAIAYNHKVDDTLWYTAGVPFSHVTWKPAHGWTVEVDYAVPFNLAAKVDYAVTETFHVFTAYDKRLDAFVLSGDVDDRRYLFEQSRLEIGFHWEPCANFWIEVAAGQAFAMEFERGFDTRDTNNITELDDESYLRFAARVGF